EHSVLTLGVAPHQRAHSLRNRVHGARWYGVARVAPTGALRRSSPNATKSVEKVPSFSRWPSSSLLYTSHACTGDIAKKLCEQPPSPCHRRGRPEYYLTNGQRMSLNTEMSTSLATDAAHDARALDDAITDRRFAERAAINRLTAQPRRSYESFRYQAIRHPIVIETQDFSRSVDVAKAFSTSPSHATR